MKDIVPHRDFFQAQFLLSLSPPGLTNVTVDTSFVDYNGRIWMTGPRATLSVRVYEEAGSKQSASSSAPGVSRQGAPTGNHMALPGTSAPGIVQRF